MNRDPSGNRELQLAREGLADYRWAFPRLVELIAEDPESDSRMLAVLDRAMERLRVENAERITARTRAHNAAHFPQSGGNAPE